ncbi:MAG: arginine--tRNA ligase, partial [Bacilli bacterium]|nr:arginine--tRNA ligase [Bacilli bacterium]
DIEYVSANPTGFLHVGHCRGAAYGDSLARIYTKAGYKVNREYYINDGGNQIENLVKSIYARYNELYGLPFELDDDCYHGKEIIEIAKMIKDEVGDKYIINNDYKYCHDYFRTFGVNYLLNNLKKDLNDFGVNFDTWFSEKSLYDNGDVAKTIEYLKKSGYTYEDEGALWLKTTEYGDEKDRVLIKSDKTLTYLTPDIAYHMNKLSRGYDELIDVLGADHYGYIPRLKAAIKFCGGNPDCLNVDILQMVRVMQNGEEVKMSKRSGKAITMRDLIDEVGADALRFLFIQKALSTQMDLDLDLALKQSNENPVYYAQYAYARIRSLFRMYPNFKEVKEFNKIDLSKCEDLITILMQYPSVIVEAASKRIPHRICQYILSLAQALHSYYNDEKIISDDELLTNEKLTLMQAVAYVLKDALGLIGVGTKEKM